MKYVVFDYETASDCDLQKRGAWVYAHDFSTFILCLAFKVIEDKQPGRTRVLTESEITRIDPELMALAKDPDVKFVAHNAGFEAAMWKAHMVPLGYPELPPEKMHDTMAVAAMKALPLGLDALTKALELPVQKDMEGHRLMMKMCKRNIKGEWEHSAENMSRLKSYCVGDVDAQYGSHVVLGGLGPSEREAWIIDQKIQQRGLRVDREFVHACIDVLEQVREPMAERFRELTGGVKFTQREKILNWVNDQGVPLGDMRKETLNAILDPEDEFGIEDFQEPLPYEVHEVLTLRRTLASSSVSKLERMLACAGHDGRVRYTTQYHAARTGRDGGRLIQIQNYPVGEISDRQGLTPEILADAIMTRDVATIQEVWGPDIFSAIISSLRSCIVPEEDKVLVAGDYAAIEARNLLSMAGQHDRVMQMHTGVDIYSETATAIFKRPIDRKIHLKEGKIGKQTFLGSGYGLGPVGHRARFIPKENIELSIMAINAYRKEIAPLVPKFWYGLWEASVNAVWCRENRTYSFAGVEFRKLGDYLTMRLPSGRLIWYHKPRKGTTFDPSGNERPSWTFMSYQGKKFRRHQAWHGMITADCIQGSARCIMYGAMKRMERNNIPTIFKVHDELVVEEKYRPDLVVTVKQIMEDVEPWAHECRFKVVANVEDMIRYRK